MAPDEYQNRFYTLATMLPILVLPTFSLWQWENTRDYDQTDTSTMIWTCAITGTIGISLDIALQGLFSYGAALLLFRNDAKKYIKEFTISEDKIKDAAHRATRRDMSRRWQYWVFLLIFCFVMAGALEEGLKYFSLTGARKYGKVVQERDYIRIPVAAAVGFATIENMAFAYGAYKSGESPIRLAMTILERTVFGIPGHAMTAALIGLNVLVRDIRQETMNMWQILLEPILFHGCFDFMLFAISAYDGNIGWVHPKGASKICVTLVLVVGIQLCLALVVKQRLDRYDIGS